MGGGELRLSGWAVFDLDGTLVDTLREISSALNRVLKKHGRGTLEKDIVRNLVGKGPRTLVERAWLQTGSPAEEKQLDGYMLEYLAEYRLNPKRMSQPFQGVDAGLRNLIRLGWRLGVCTNKDGRSAHSLVKNLGWESWIRIVVSGDDSARKPDPRPLLMALQRLAAPSGRHVFVGDSEVDMLTAKNAGIEGVFLGHGYGESQGMEDHHFSSAVDMFSWMAKSGPKNLRPKSVPSIL